MVKATIDDVKKFWENNPLFAGESLYPVGSKEFFDEHTRIIYDDCFSSEPINNFIPNSLSPDAKILDLGCGIGFWPVEFAKKGFSHIYACDITQTALSLTSQRLRIHDISAVLSLENAEHLSFPDAYFDHVNCQGVIHHTPDTDAAIKEIARVLKKDGTASISVYYKNAILRAWPVLSSLGKILFKFGFALRGRGRESIYLQTNTDEIVRLYDGDKNPVGKSYKRDEIIQMLSHHFIVSNVFLYFFPARSFPFRIPTYLKRFLSKRLGFMIHLTVKKK